MTGKIASFGRHVLEFTEREAFLQRKGTGAPLTSWAVVEVCLEGQGRQGFQSMGGSLGSPLAQGKIGQREA